MARVDLEQVVQGRNLYVMPFEDLCKLAGSLEEARVGDQGIENARKRTPDEQYVIDAWYSRARQRGIEENQAEYQKDLRGEPNDFDPYAPY